MKTFLVLLALLCSIAFGKDLNAVLQSGVDDFNSNNFARSNIKSCNIGNLTLTCTKNLTWVPANSFSVYNGIAYFGDLNGYVYAMNISAPDCPYIWTNYLPAQTGRYGVQTLYGSTGSSSRNTPALVPKYGIFVLGDLSSARVWGLNMSTGVILWETLLDSYYYARITAEPSIGSDDQSVYIGVSSLEEGDPACFGALPAYCVFRGKFVKLNIFTGSLIWQFNTSVGDSSNPYGYAGAPVWGSTFPKMSGKVCFATGNSYRIPDNVTACLNNNGTMDSCADPNHLSNSVVCVYEASGLKAWSYRFDLDVWTIACGPDGAPPGIFPLPTCDFNNNQGDIDFGQAPMIVTIHKKGKKINALLIGQKSGYVHALNFDTGAKIYSVFTGPTSTVGGILFGHAYDGKQAYFSNVNGFKNFTTLVDGYTNCTGGILSAIEPNTGTILWQACDPYANRTYGTLSVSRNTVWTGSLNYQGPNLFAYKNTGELIFSAQLVGSQFSSPVFYGNYMMVGSGYIGKTFYNQGTTIYVWKMTGDENCDCDDH
jgi:polyvinyl alcohol dehydrogenase (cytochrome)